MSSDRTDITQCLRELRQGNQAAADALIPVIYRELKKLAVSCMRGEQPGRTLQPTALVSEVFIRLLRGKKVDWQNRAHFFGCAAGTMRHIIIDSARRRHAGRRGADFQFVDCENVEGQRSPTSIEEVLAVDECLRRLNDIDKRQARFVELRFFGGLTVDEIAEVEHVSAPTVKRELRSAQAWLRREMTRLRKGTGNGTSTVAAG
jgi:RNA polymerase sigma-70 factor, ECF subfamily